jgi:hypothetical protein
VITIWHSVALGSILSVSVSVAATLPQYNPHLGLNEQDQAALAQHRLTVENVRQMFAVDRELLKLLKKVPDLDARASELEKGSDAERLGIFTVGPTVYETIPEVAQILQKHKISARDYMLTKIAAMIADMVSAAPAGALQRDGISERDVSTPAVKFWTAMDPALKAEAAQWNEVRRQLAKHGRQKVW